MFWAVFDTPSLLAATALVFFCAQVVYVAMGFGAGLIAVGTLALLLPDVRDAVVILLLVATPIEVAVVYRSRQALRGKGIAWVLVGVLVGVPVGTWLLGHTDENLLLTVLGVVLVIVAVVMFVLPTQQRRAGRPLSTLAGLSSGVLTGMFGTGGPPLIVFFRWCGLDRTAFRSALLTVFLASGLVRWPSYVAAGFITTERMLAAAAVAPAALLGAWVGARLHARIDEALFRRLVSLALVVLGIVLIARAA